MLDSVRDWSLDKGALRRMALGVVLLLLMVFGPSVYGWASSGGRLADGLDNPGGRSNIEIRMSFTPTAYHQQELGKHGVFGGIRDNSIILLNVEPDQLKSLSHLYWIDSIHVVQRN